MQEFDRQLTLSQEENLQFKLVKDPFSMDPEEVPIQLQLEVIEQQASSVCETKIRESSLLDFYISLNTDNATDENVTKSLWPKQFFLTLY